MKKLVIGILVSLLLIASTNYSACGQSKLDTLLPLRGFCIALPTPDNLDEFINFIKTELAPRNVNTLVLRVEYKYKFKATRSLLILLPFRKGK